MHGSTEKLKFLPLKNALWEHYYDTCIPPTIQNISAMMMAAISRYAINPSRCDQTATTKLVKDITIVVDKMHMRGHVDAWCKRNCDPKLFSDLNKVSDRYIMGL